MSDSRDHSGRPAGTAGMDEMLCEYVDGTMEPDVREVFEECLQSDEELAREVHRLRNARLALSQYGDSQETRRIERRLRDRLQGCLEEASVHQSRTAADTADDDRPSQKPIFARLRARSKVVGAVVAAFVVGLCAGGLLFGPPTDQPAAAALEAPPPASTPPPSLMSAPAPRLHPALAPFSDSAGASFVLRPAARQP
ncbi:MAG: hypothetical protein BRD45_05920 [Bacteroidetes bacterium QS_8_64_10]|nr:MAG: hypothetical protein BRD45_05920 [Bacteroidetes bacterium QS_8_64_10]